MKRLAILETIRLYILSEDIIDKLHTIVIGGSRGLGREVSKLFANEGHIVSVIGSRHPEEVKEDFAFRYFQIEITNEAELKKGIGKVLSDVKTLNNLVFAQRYRRDEDPWHGEISTSVSATRSIIDLLSECFSASRSNSIVITSSVYGECIGASQPVGYHVAKAALDQMIKYYGVYLGKRGIRVNGVSPGTFQKNESKDYYQSKTELLDLYSRITPLGRMGTANDVAQVIMFLCSDKASFVTGQNIVVDGGVSLIAQESLARDLMSV